VTAKKRPLVKRRDPDDFDLMAVDGDVWPEDAWDVVAPEAARHSMSRWASCIACSSASVIGRPSNAAVHADR
jgi:hypothetical protein